MKLFLITLFLTFTNLHAAIICCCDDTEEALNSEIQSVIKMKEDMKKAGSTLEDRFKHYAKAKAISNGSLLVDAGALAAANKLKDSVSVKETFEGLVANSQLDQAKVGTATTTAKIRNESGDEAKKFSYKRR